MSQCTRDGSTYSLGQDEPLSLTVVRTVADAEGVEPTALRPLYSAVDPDALDSLFESGAGDGLGFAGEVQFQYHGYDVCIHSDGRVTLTRA
ncbi:HalOD1 output domain-containing protein [Halopelagius fulvigenes]|uniref:HalOD1 output domain-containing protein n=1 Tax=Halopelagius fulvigenes TaxID=1198324 RepID=A0ABD5U2K0_9EURY